MKILKISVTILVLFITLSLTSLLFTIKYQPSWILNFTTSIIEKSISKKLNQNVKINYNDLKISYKNNLFYLKSNNISLNTNKKLHFIVKNFEVKFDISSLIKFRVNEILADKLYIYYEKLDTEKKLLPDSDSINKKFTESLFTFFTKLEYFDSLSIKEISLIQKNNQNLITKIGSTKDLFINKSNIILRTNTESSIKLKCLTISDIDKNCNIFIENFSLNKNNILGEHFNIFKNIEGKIDAKITFFLKENYISSPINYNITSHELLFNKRSYFSKKLLLSDIKLNGKINQNLNNLSIDNANLIIDNKIRLELSLLIKNFYNLGYINLNFKLKNIYTNNLKKYWPLFIEKDKKIKEWITNNLYDGIIDNSETNLEFVNGKFNNVRSKIIFSGINLKYSSEFKPINNLDGIAYFDKKSVSVKFSSGKIENKKINSATFYINDFFNPIIDINLDIDHSISKILSYLDYHKYLKYLNQIDYSLNSKISISIPLVATTNNIKNISIKSFSKMENINHKLIDNKPNSNIVILLNKKLNKENFYIDVNLNDNKINLFPILNKNKLSGKIRFTFSTKDNNLQIKNFIWKVDNKKKILFSLVNNENKINFSLLNFKENNFQSSIVKTNNIYLLKLTGEKLSLRTNFVKNLFEKNQNLNKKINLDKEIQNHKIKANIELKKLNINNIEFHKIKSYINCHGIRCFDSFFIANDKNNMMKLSLYQNENLDYDHSILNFEMNDVSKLLKIFQLYAVKTKKIKIQGIITNNNSKISTTGNIKVNDLLINTKVINKLDSTKDETKNEDDIMKFHNLFSKFVLRNNELKIEDFILNNYFLGITANGNIDLLNQKIDIKGVFIPGYSINNLFGIEKIPIIGNIISKIILGNKHEGILAIKYKYKKEGKDDEGKVTTDMVSIMIPNSIRNIIEKLVP